MTNNRTGELDRALDPASVYRNIVLKYGLELAKHLGVSVVFISDVERGNRAPFTSEKILKVTELLGVDPEPLLQATAETRGTFELDATQVSGKARQVGVALMRGWTELDEKELEQIAQIVRRRGRMKRCSTVSTGFVVDR